MSAPARSRLNVDERRAQLLTLGLQLFSERSFDAISIDEIAREAGISKGLLYHYFPSKKVFYVETVREAARQLLERLTPRIRLHPDVPGQALRDGLRVFIEFVEEHAEPYLSLMTSGLGVDPAVGQVIDEARQALLERMVGALPFEMTPMRRIALRANIAFAEAAALSWAERQRSGEATDAEREQLIDVIATAFESVMVKVLST